MSEHDRNYLALIDDALAILRKRLLLEEGALFRAFASNDGAQDLIDRLNAAGEAQDIGTVATIAAGLCIVLAARLRSADQAEALDRLGPENPQ